MGFEEAAERRAERLEELYDLQSAANNALQVDDVDGAVAAAMDAARLAALHLGPNDPAQLYGHALLGQALVRAGRPDQAAEQLQAAQRLAMVHADLLDELQLRDVARVALQQLAVLYKARGELPWALDAYRRYQAMLRSGTAAMAACDVAVGEVLRGLSRFQEAADAFWAARETLVRLGEDPAAALEATLLLADVKAAVGRYADALALYLGAHDEVEAQQPERLVSVYLNVGMCLREQRRPADAVVMYERAAQLASAPADMAACEHHLGDLLLARGRAEDALACFERALSVVVGSGSGSGSGGDVACHLRIGDLHAGQDDWPAAMAAYHSARAVAAELEDGALLRACDSKLAAAHAAQGRPRRAAAMYEELLAADDGHSLFFAEIRNALANLRRVTGHDEDALRLYQQALSAYTDACGGDYHCNAPLHNNIGHLLAHVGALQDARRHYEAALELRRAAGTDVGAVAQCLRNLALLEWQGKDVAAAVAWLEEEEALVVKSYGAKHEWVKDVRRLLARFRRG